MKKLFFALPILLLISSISLFAQNSPAISLIPAKSVAVLRVDWTRVRTDEKLKPIVNGQKFAELAGQLGVSENKVAEWIIFSDVNPTSAQGTGMLLAGNFTAQSIVQFAGSKDWKAERIGTYTAFVNPSDNSYVMPIRNGLLAAGTKTAIEKVQSAIGKPRNSLVGKQPFSSVWAELGGNRRPVAFFVGIPQEYEKIADIAFKVATKLMDLTGFGLIGKVFETIGLVRSLGFTASYSKGVFPTEIVAVMDSENKAWIASGALNLLKKAPSAIGMQPRTADDEKMMKSLQTMSAGYKKEMLSVKFEMPESAMSQR